MLVDPKLSLFTGEETTYGSYEADRPQHKITQFRLVSNDRLYSLHKIQDSYVTNETNKTLRFRT